MFDIILEKYMEAVKLRKMTLMEKIQIGLIFIACIALVFFNIMGWYILSLIVYIVLLGDSVWMIVLMKKTTAADRIDSYKKRIENVETMLKNYSAYELIDYFVEVGKTRLEREPKDYYFAPIASAVGVPVLMSVFSAFSKDMNFNEYIIFSAVFAILALTLYSAFRISADMIKVIRNQRYRQIEKMIEDLLYIKSDASTLEKDE